MKFAVVVPNVGAFSDPRTLARLAGSAETAGWDGFFVWDLLEYEDEPACDVWIALAAAAVATERIRFGPLVASMSRRRPWKLAREALTLDHLSGGRLILCTGAGYKDAGLTTFGEPSDAATKFELFNEGLEVLNGLLNEDPPFSFRGKRFTVKEASFLPRPVQGRIPIWVTSNNALEAPGSLRRAARYDGVLGGITLANLEKVGDYIGRHRDPVRPFDIVARAEDEARAITDPDEIQAHERAGATWLRYEVGSQFDSLADAGPAAEFIGAGPPGRR